MNPFRLPPRRPRHAPRALTMIEVLVVVTVIGILVALTAPSMANMIGMQRLRSISAQLNTDLQYARSEAVSRNQFVAFKISNDLAKPVSCYVVFASIDNPLDPNALLPDKCDCSRPPGSMCDTATPGGQRELRSGQVSRDLGILLRKPSAQADFFVLDPIAGSIMPDLSSEGALLEYCVEVTRPNGGRLRSEVSLGGRTRVCTPDSSVPGVDRCPPTAIVNRTCPAIAAP